MNLNEKGSIGENDGGRIEVLSGSISEIYVSLEYCKRYF
jgi:hypothetical protein